MHGEAVHLRFAVWDRWVVARHTAPNSAVYQDAYQDRAPPQGRWFATYVLYPPFLTDTRPRATFPDPEAEGKTPGDAPSECGPLFLPPTPAAPEMGRDHA